ncbi:MAG: amino acid ABC transporter substrate-binding protein [Alphaproteobacteria bacterium]
MNRRTVLAAAAAALVAGTLGWNGVAAQELTSIKIGAIGPKTGPLAGGAAVTHWPNIQLWVETVNEKGGIMLSSIGKRVPIELIEYDDRTSNEEAVKAVERLATQDEADFIIAPYGTALNLATAPLFAKHGYPQIAVTAISDRGPDFVERWPNSFWVLGSSTAFASAVAEVLKRMREEGTIGDKVAMVNVADAFGIELANAGRKAMEDAGFDLVYDKSYPLGTQDLSPVINEAKRSEPDAFVAFSYPPDTFALTEQAGISGLNPKAFYVGVATAFPGYAGKFGAAAEGVMGAGGVNPNTAKMKEYRERHMEVTGKPADYWASAVVYASLELLEQAIERVGKIDRAAVIDELRTGEFDTVIGTVKFNNNINENYWTVGQWQDGTFYGIASTGMEGAKEPILKPAWN